MPIIAPGDPALAELEGLHLWHGNLSSCSQRARIVLAEKGLEWQSHLIDIPNNEHATPEYQAINPNGLVPTLVHDGAVVIESIDIIDHIDRAFPEPPLRPAGDPEADAVMRDWMARADAAQADLKLLSHEFLFRPRKRMSPEALEDFARHHNNAVLVEFLRDFNSEDGFGTERIAGAVDRTDADFAGLDRAVEARPWIAHDQFGLADIAWMPNLHRMSLMDWPLDRYPHLAAWFERVKARPSYRTALVDWEPEPARALFADYTTKRRAEGTDVRAFGALAAS